MDVFFSQIKNILSFEPLFVCILIYNLSFEEHNKKNPATGCCFAKAVTQEKYNQLERQVKQNLDEDTGHSMTSFLLQLPVNTIKPVIVVPKEKKSIIDKWQKKSILKSAEIIVKYSFFSHKNLKKRQCRKSDTWDKNLIKKIDFGRRTKNISNEKKGNGHFHFETVANNDCDICIPLVRYKTRDNKPCLEALLAIGTTLNQIKTFSSFHFQTLRDAMIVGLSQVGVWEAFGKEESERAESYNKMLSLLEAPLARITESLTKTQIDSQRLRSILYAPTRSIFSAQSSIAELFEEGAFINNPDSTIIATPHKPELIKDINKTDAVWILAHALARFRGQVELEEKTAIKALRSEVCQIKSNILDEHNPLSEFAKAILYLLDINSFDNNEIMKLTDITKTIDYLNKIKERLFTPFKIDERKNPIRIPILKALLPKVKLEKNYENIIPVIAKDANPFLTQGHLLEFLSTFVAQHINKKGKEFNLRMVVNAKKSGDIYTPVTLRFISTMDWIENDKKSDFMTFFEELSEAAENKLIKEGEYGNFHLPFVTLIRRHPNPSKKLGLLKIENTRNNEIKLKLNADYLYLKFNGNKFDVFSKQES